jgi:two-component system LytT family response regulator
MVRLGVPRHAKASVLDADEVDWIGSKSAQAMVHVGGQVYPIRRSLTELEARLDPARFFHTHRSTIVNLDRVQRIIPWFKDGHILRLTTGAEVDSSRTQAQALRRMLGW